MLVNHEARIIIENGLVEVGLRVIACRISFHRAMSIEWATIDLKKTQTDAIKQ